MPEINRAWKERYSRQLILPEVGGKGQKRLEAAKVLLVGVGGLGSAAACYLAAAGVGRLGLVDSDRIALSDLQRQILYRTADLGKLKTKTAAKALKAINPELITDIHSLRLNPENTMEIIKDYDIIVDGSDNFATRYLLNDACFFAQKPLSHGAVLGTEGLAMTILPGKGPCYRCLFPEMPPPGLIPACREAGVLGVLPGLIGIVQATEVLKIILGQGSLLNEKLLLYSALEMSFNRVKVSRAPECPLCGKNPRITRLLEYETACEPESAKTASRKA